MTLGHISSSISDPSAIAEVFNNYFSIIASNLDGDIPHSNFLHCISSEHHFKIIFSAPPSDSEEIVNLIRRRKNKSTDLMNIPVFTYKILSP